MIIPIELSFKADKDTRLTVSTNKTIKSHDINSVEFHIAIEGLELTNNHTAKILSIFHSSKSQVNTDCEIVEGKIIYKPNTNLISMYETVTNYVYVYHNDKSVDVCAFKYTVDLSKIDETALKVKEVYDQSYADLLAEFERALSDYKDSLPQVDSVRATITEVSQARGSYPTLAERLNETDNKQRQTTAQLAKTTQYSENLNSKLNTSRLPQTTFNNVKKLRSCNVFVDDDGNSAILTKLKPLSQRTGVPFTVALVSNFLQSGNGIGVNDALSLQNDLGWEIASHSKSHLGLGTVGITDAQIEEEMKDSVEFMRGKGLNVTNFVYPGGQYNDNIIKHASKYYNCALGTGTYINTVPFNTYKLGRLSFPGVAPNNTLEYYKSKVDEANANNGTIIWMLHCGQDVFTAEQESILEQLIEYIKSIDVDILTVQQMLDSYGNFIDINDGQYYIASDGRNNMVNYVPVRTDSITGKEKINADMLPNDFENYKTYVSGMATATEIAKFPSGVRGVFEVFRHGLNSYQTYTNADGLTFKRYANTNNTWGAWKQQLSMGGMKQSTIATFSVPANSYVGKTLPLGAYSHGKMAIVKPRATLPAGIVFTTYVDGINGVIRLIFQNLTASSLTVPDMDWNYLVMDVVAF